MKKNKRFLRSILTLLAVIALIAVYYIFPEEFTTPVTPTPTNAPVPTVLSETTTSSLFVFPTPWKTTGCKSDGILPDPGCTPGAISQKVTDELLGKTVCVPNYTSTVRPDLASTKIKLLIAYGIDPSKKGDYELDHLIPLSIGGCEDCDANLWPQPKHVPNSKYDKTAKDNLEKSLHADLCSGKIDLLETQRQVAEDWTVLWRKYYGE
jgi:hypothetical protein